MSHKSTSKVFVVVPNWNGEEYLSACLDSLLKQSIDCRILVVDNGSVDSSLDLIQSKYSSLDLIKHKDNLGFAGGVNSGIRFAISEEAEFVALFNNDATADKNWLANLKNTMDKNSNIGIVACKFMDSRGENLDSTGDLYTIWGLPYPRGRGESSTDKYDQLTDVFGASGGASLYRIKMLQQIGLFDEDFFAYYEDIDISFRAQLLGWKVCYAPSATAYHHIGGTSSKIGGFTTYQTMKNLPWIMVKNMPGSLLWASLPRFTIAYMSILSSAVSRGEVLLTLKGCFVSAIRLPKKIFQRLSIQHRRKVPVSYIKSILEYDLPPNAHKLRKVRDLFVRSKSVDT